MLPGCGLRGCRAGLGIAMSLREMREMRDAEPRNLSRERRAQHREACIAAVKRSRDYGAVARHVARPATPDPRQADVSKRAWEKSVRLWRMDLKAFAARGWRPGRGGGRLGGRAPARPQHPAHVRRPASVG